jgi:hypothetical protein
MFKNSLRQKILPSMCTYYPKKQSLALTCPTVSSLLPLAIPLLTMDAELSFLKNLRTDGKWSRKMVYIPKIKK